MAAIIQKPDNLSLSGNLKDFKLASASTIKFKLMLGNTLLIEQSYEPGPNKEVVVDVRSIIEGQLSFEIKNDRVYQQNGLVKTFTAEIDGVTSSFRVIRAGVANLADTPANWLSVNFLTWQPRFKKVTYYSPEWLTYYATQDCNIHLSATFEDGSVQSFIIHSCSAGTAYTFNMEYSVIAGLFSDRMPASYSVVAKVGSKAISMEQNYIVSGILSENEEWILFENSLGGIDCFRAYGTTEFTGEHTHNIAEFGDVSEEYSVDTSRLYNKNTGYLNEYERRWLLDFFPSRRKYFYDRDVLRRIVVTEDNVTYKSSDLPSSFTFKYKFAESQPYLNLVRNEEVIPETLVIKIPDSADFYLPPRLAEWSRLQLTEGVLFPVQEPHSEKWGTTTFGELLDVIKTDVLNNLPDFSDLFPDDGGSGGGLNVYIIKENDLTPAADDNVFSALRTLKEIRKSMEVIDKRYLRKDIPDTAHGLITFEAGFCTPGYVEGFTTKAKGLKALENGDLTLMMLRAREDALFGSSLSSEQFFSGFPNGSGWMLAPYLLKNAAGVDEVKYKLELDDLTVRRNFRVFEMIISQLKGENDNVIFSGQMKVDHWDPNTNTIYLKTEGVLYNTFRPGDILMVQRFGGLPSAENDYQVIKYYELRVTVADIGNLDDGDKRLDYICFDNFVGDLNSIEENDVLTRADNDRVSTRKGLMRITTIDEFGAPFLDVIYGMKTDPLNCTKVRLGNLGGVVTPYWGRLEGWGLLATNAYLKGRFLLQNGEDVQTKFEITEGLIRSEISSIRNEISAQYNYLSNASFSQDTEKWEAISDIKFFTVNGRFLYINDNFYSNKQSVAAVVIEGARRSLRLKKSGIKQLNTNLANKPSMDITNPDGTKGFPVFYISFKYKCLKGGNLSIGFPKKELYVTERVEPNNVYETKEYSGVWDGTGDFSINFSGDIYIYSLSLADNPLENFRIEVQTRFYQTDERIGLWAQKTDKIQGTITQLGIDLNALDERLLIYANKTDSINGTVTQLGISLDAAKKQMDLFVKDEDLTGYELVSRISLAPSWIKIASKNINLEGAVSFSSLESKLQTTINGKVNTSQLGNLAYQSEVKEAMKKEGLIVGGYMSMSLIDTENLFAKIAHLGGFKIASNSIFTEENAYSGLYASKFFLYSSGGSAFLGFSSSNKWAGIGLNTLPSTLGGTTALGRFENTASNPDNINYGLYVNVANGQRNYGLWSTASCVSPSFISIKSERLYISGNGNSVDFSKTTTFVISTSVNKIQVSLPSSSDVASMFGLRYLPSDFVLRIMFIYAATSGNTMSFVGLTDNDGNDNLSVGMAKGDIIELLITNYSGFKYQLLNYRN